MVPVGAAAPSVLSSTGSNRASLPFTGRDIERLTALGSAFLVAGGVLVRRTRRRPAHARRKHAHARR